MIDILTRHFVVARRWCIRRWSCKPGRRRRRHAVAKLYSLLLLLVLLLQAVHVRGPARAKGCWLAVHVAKYVARARVGCIETRVVARCCLWRANRSSVRSLVQPDDGCSTSLIDLHSKVAPVCTHDTHPKDVKKKHGYTSYDDCNR